MIYKFKSKAAGDVIMLGASGDDVLRTIGKSPAAQGIVEVADMPAAMQAIEAAITADESAHERAGQDARSGGQSAPSRDGVSLRQRAWPLVEMMKRAHAAGEPIVWGV